MYHNFAILLLPSVEMALPSAALQKIECTAICARFIIETPALEAKLHAPYRSILLAMNEMPPVRLMFDQVFYPLSEWMSLRILAGPTVS